MNDNDPAERIKQIRDDMAAKSRLLLARRPYVDAQGRISPENEQRALTEAGLPGAPAPEQTPEENLDQLRQNIADAEQAGDHETARTLKSQLLTANRKA